MAIAVLKDFADYPTLGRRIIGRTHQSYWGRKSEYTENNKPSLSLTNYIKLYPPKYLSYIVAVSFIGEGNRSTRRKSPSYRKSMTNFIT